MKPNLTLLLLMILLFSCEKENLENNSIEKVYSSEISYDISEHLVSDEAVKKIEFAPEGYYYSIGKTIFFSGWESGKSFSFEATSDILSMAYNPKDNALYFGTHSSGLGRFEDDNIQYFTIDNSELPRDLIRNVECDDSGNIWFNSSAHQLGGLIKYDGRKFTTYLPENSNLPENLIYNVKVKNGSVYILSRGLETGKVGLKLRNNSWKKLFESGGCDPTDMVVDSDGNMYYFEDSREYCGGGLLPDDVVFVFKDGKKTILREYDGVMHIPYYMMNIDKRDYLWTCKFLLGDYKRLSVYDGENWHEAPDDFPDAFINCIEVDNDNNIWLGTNNGIFILNQ